MSAIPVEVNKVFDLSPEAIVAVEASISSERLARYIASANGDRAAAVRLYTWNTAVSAAFYAPLQGLEVALRNSLHSRLSQLFGTEWYDNPATGLDIGTLRRIDAARSDLTREGYREDAPHMVAALPFGFWVSLLGPGGRLPSGAKANYEMSLWRNGMFRAFPNARISRKAAHGPLDYLRTLRNRIAHHEPIYQRHLAADYASLLQVTGWINIDMRDWIAGHSRVPEVLASRYDNSNFRF